MGRRYRPRRWETGTHTAGIIRRAFQLTDCSTRMPPFSRFKPFCVLPARYGAAALLLGVMLLAGALPATAQELFCDVMINYKQLAGSGFTFLDDLEEEIENYINDNNWTDDRFLEEERIECTMTIVFQEAVTLTSFRAQLIVTSTRPIYGTEATTTVLQINDNNWQFEYAQGSPLIVEPDRFDALTSVINFYIYIILGYDYDTFSEFGGEEHFQRARRIFDLARAQNAIGWGGLGEGSRRVAIINQILDARLKPLRAAYFKYHFHGLDHFVSSTDAARQAVLDVLQTMQELYDNLSRRYVTDLFFSTKYQELTAIFDQSPVSSQAYALLSQVDPAHLTTYNELVQ